MCLPQREDLAVISAQQYYVDYGLELSIDRLSSLLPSYLPDSYIETQKDINYWIQVCHTKHCTPVLSMQTVLCLEDTLELIIISI